MRKSRAGLDVPRSEAFSRYRRFKAALVRERRTLQTRHVFARTECRHQTLETDCCCELDRSFANGARAQSKDPPPASERLDQTPDDRVVSTGVADNQKHSRTLGRQLLKIDANLVRDEAIFRWKHPSGIDVAAVAVRFPQNTMLCVDAGAEPPFKSGLEEAVPVQGHDPEHPTSEDESGKCFVSL
jgi:hypothetical protein